MFVKLLSFLLGNSQERLLKSYRKTLSKIQGYESEFAALDSQQIDDKCRQIKQLMQSHTPQKYQDQLFALVREVSSRLLGLRHYDVQILGGLALCENKIAEMGTGEGKTLVATLPACYMAFQGKKVFVVTVNDYLAKRDAAWMKPLYEAMGLTIGISVSSQSRQEKKKAYQSDIIYVTNNELGFDYLRDKMVLDAQELVLPPLDFALVDEVDSILIDEARVPLIISGPKETDLDLYKKLDTFVPHLSQAREMTRDHLGVEIVDENSGDFIVDEKDKLVYLTDKGFEKLELLLSEAAILTPDASLYAPEQADLLHHCHCALKAHHLFTRDTDYIVSAGKVVIIDEHTGRASAGRRWADGMHQAIEAKEHTEVMPETQTLASTTFQNFFRLFSHIAGMTGTADTEAGEFKEIYDLDVVIIPPNVSSRRTDHSDLVFVTDKAKYGALLTEVKAIHKTGQPILIGTSAISQSEYLSELLTKEKITHTVLNAKQHEKEAGIIALAGRKGSVTIATNMAGRGTDIVLGGTYAAFLEEYSLTDSQDVKLRWEQAQEEVNNLGGLAILACQRHESRRIDNQLRGRAGRQGDCGSSKFYVSLDDHLMRIFMPQTIRQMLIRLQDDPLAPLPGDKMLSRKIEQVQRTIEGQHFEIRKQVLEFDDVSNQQRQVVYDCRDQILLGDNTIELLHDYIDQSIDGILAPFINDRDSSQWQLEKLSSHFRTAFDVELDIEEVATLEYEGLSSRFTEILKDSYNERTRSLCQDQLEKFQKTVILQTFDKLWREHLSTLESLKHNMRLQRYAQKDPRQQYKLEAFALFEKLMENITLSITQTFLRVQFYSRQEMDAIAQSEKEKVSQIDSARQQELTQTNVSSLAKKVGRNDKCPCGSGNKYKYCCGAVKVH